MQVSLLRVRVYPILVSAFAIEIQIIILDNVVVIAIEVSFVLIIALADFPSHIINAMDAINPIQAETTVIITNSCPFSMLLWLKRAYKTGGT